ncbi:MAG TPA: SH3 domain-containing protein [Pyrinomonadaceae bacterium]|nr:SH3 domain-containing protein [Pyrinomonadaceae bacterium]
MKNKLTTTATLMLAMLFGTIVMPQTVSANTFMEFTPTTQDYCVVRERNNNAPLNVRKTPNGRIIGKLQVGEEIEAWDVVADRNGYNWTKITWGNGYAWVATEFISCG